MALRKCECGKAYDGDRLKKCPFCKRPNPDYPSWANKIKRDAEKQNQEQKRESSISSCKSCGHAVSDMAMTCPSCGQQCPSPNFYSPGAEVFVGFFKFIFWVGVGILVLLVVFYLKNSA